MSERGQRIVIEGGDGVGKSTTMHLLAARNRTERGRTTYTLEEPDSLRDEQGNALVPIAEELRTLIKSKKIGRSALSNVHLFNVARRENLLQGIEPALEAGIDIFCARDWNSTTVYQGYGQGWGLQTIEDMVLAATSDAYMHPDHTFVLDLDEKSRQFRLASRDSNATLDTFESLPDDFQERVGEGYRLHAANRGYHLISAAPAPAEVADTIWQHIRRDD